MTNVCRRCNGSRIISGLFQTAMSCPQCNGSGKENNRIYPYYVIWFNRERCILELHKPFCEHALYKKTEAYFSLGGDAVDPKQMVKTLPDNYRTVALLMEDCLA